MGYICSLYHSDDAEYASDLKGLPKQLKLMLRGKEQNWTQLLVNETTEWSQELREQLQHSSVIFLFISPSFLDSGKLSALLAYALQRHEMRTARVIPLHVQPTDGLDTSSGDVQFEGLLAIPRTPMSLYSDKDDLWSDISSEVRPLVLYETNHPRIAEEPADLSDFFA